GRDLLRLQAANSNKKTAMVIANPDFDSTAATTKAQRIGGERIAHRIETSEHSQSRIAERMNRRLGPRLGSVQFLPLKPLPGSAIEGKQLKALLPAVALLTGARATETALKQVSKPSILHISTHGVFLEDVPRIEADERQRLLVRLQDAGEPEAHLQKPKVLNNPLLRSGLFFAGANMGKSGDDDGV